jgi:Bacteriocin-protection, YdeI or OmpD-Associated
MAKTSKQLSGGVVHELPEDLLEALTTDAAALAAWEDLTPLARNEWICWTISVKKPETRRQHVDRVCGELKEGVRRPCCWMGCVHRTDKPVSPSVQYVLSKRSKGSS